MNKAINEAFNFYQFIDIQLKPSMSIASCYLPSSSTTWLHLLPMYNAVPIPQQGKFDGGCMDQRKEVLAK